MSSAWQKANNLLVLITSTNRIISMVASPAHSLYRPEHTGRAGHKIWGNHCTEVPRTERAKARATHFIEDVKWSWRFESQYAKISKYLWQQSLTCPHKKAEGEPVKKGLGSFLIGLEQRKHLLDAAFGCEASSRSLWVRVLQRKDKLQKQPQAKLLHNGRKGFGLNVRNYVASLELFHRCSPFPLEANWYFHLFCRSLRSCRW